MPSLPVAWDRWGTWLTVVILGAIVIRYAYLWLFRRKPFENNVVLGTLSHRLYLRYGKLWLVGALAAAVVWLSCVADVPGTA